MASPQSEKLRDLAKLTESSIIIAIEKVEF